MLLRVLGPLEIAGDDGPIDIGTGQPTTVLAALAIGRGAVCSIDSLIDAVWGETPPASAPKLLQIYASRLRKVLPDGLRIATSPTGYMLEVEPEAVDAVQFERHVADGRAALGAGNPALAAAAFSRALALWRGAAYADVRYAAFARAEIDRLDHLRELAQRLRVDARLELGQHATVLGELRGLLADDPMNEALAARAMLAAYRTSGAAEALEVFNRLSGELRREMDADPGRAMQTLRERILRRDPGLDLEPALATQTAAPLPVPPSRLVGRRRELAELRALLAKPGVRLVSLTGAGGSGKSRLALELAHQVGRTFANGAVLVELASLTDPGLVPATIATALGLDPGTDPMGTLIAALTDRELLLVIDNLEQLREAAPDLVRLLASAPRLVIVVTTRVVLHVSGEHVYAVSPLVDDEAVALFVERAQAQDPTIEFDAAGAALAARICRRLDGLPLAIELAASRVRALGLRGLDERLPSTDQADGPRDLPARQRTLRATVAWSVRLLEPAHADALAGLAIFAGSWSTSAARLVAGADDAALINLVDHNLIRAFELRGERRFRMLETIREYAIERLGNRREEVESALVSWMVDLVSELTLEIRGSGQREAFERLDLELDNLRAALRFAAVDPDPTREFALTSESGLFWRLRGHVAEGSAIYDSILERRGFLTTTPGVRVARQAAALAWATGDPERAAALAEATIRAAERIGDVREQSGAHLLLGVIATTEGRTDASLRHQEEALRLAESAGLWVAAASARMNIGVAYLDAGRLDEARYRLMAVLEERRAAGDPDGIGVARLNLGETEFKAGNLIDAEAHFVAAADALRAFGNRIRLANALQGLAAVEARTQRHDSAARNLGRAASILRGAGWAGDGEGLAAEAAAATREALGDGEFERHYDEGARAGEA